MKQPIRLTNKTAIALRKSAQRTRTMHYTAATLLSIAMAVAAVHFGIKWLPAVPLTVIACVLLDCAIVTHARSAYLLLIGQAICTEAAAREIRAGNREKRKERPVSSGSQEKMNPAESRKTQDVQPFFEKGMNAAAEQAMLEGKTVVLPAKNTIDEEPADSEPRRRRQQKSLQLIKSNQAKRG